jgi:16S rRNA (cytosine967-C5)-methyltransferase
VRHHERQVAILTSATSALRRGGRILYSTCSLEQEENERVIEECLQLSPGYRPLPLEDQLSKIVERGGCSNEAASALQLSDFRNGFLRTLPGVHSCDGFFAAMLVRE